MKNIITKENYTPYQLKFPLEISQIIDADDPVCTFSEVMDHIDLSKYFAEEGCKKGRPRCDAVKIRDKNRSECQLLYMGLEEVMH